jgi:lipopolysaccharide/colanic/teichoic acid biosynthesis glycosyltransferase
MRKMRIDEIPQFKNILRGEMSLVGPRPERKLWVDQFEKEIPYYNARHLVKPGITGWAQVMYPYGANVEDARQKLMYDLYYIKHWSLWLELKTIWKTVMVVLGKRGL